MRISRPLPTRDVDILFSDVNDGNATITRHGFLPKLTGLISQFLRGDGTWAQVTEAAIALSDVTTGDVTTLHHGFTPKLPGTTTQFLRADGTWATPPSTPWTSYYFGLISQTGTGDPTQIVIDNTIGALTWTRTGSGVYHATRTDAFPLNKTFVLMPGFTDLGFLVATTHTNASTIVVKTLHLSGTNSDGGLNKTPLMILVFP